MGRRSPSASVSRLLHRGEYRNADGPRSFPQVSLTLEDIDRWDSASIAEVGQAATDRGHATRTAADGLGAVLSAVQWDGHTADAARADMWKTRLEMYRHADLCESVARAASRAAAQVGDLRCEWRAIQDLATSWQVTIDKKFGAVSWTEPPFMSANDKTMLELTAKTVALRIHKLLELADQIDAELAGAITNVRSLGLGGGDVLRSPGLLAQEDRRANQKAAFHAALGREPISVADWETAAALDPHSYEPKNRGVAPNIAVGRIKPVPGQGVVRTNLFIPGDRAWAILDDNLGDARGFDPKAGPEQSRVTLYVDYENGIVVARQNPSVKPGAEPETGTPEVKVSQNPNGSVLIEYLAADPLTPGGEQFAKLSPWKVNGRLVIKPTDAGAIAGGVISDFPAVEIYQDRQGSTTLVDRIMPENIGSLGPFLGLPLSQQLGPGLMGEFPEDVHPAHPPTPSRATVGPNVIPYPAVELGPVDQRVTVPVGN